MPWTCLPGGEKENIYLSYPGNLDFIALQMKHSPAGARNYKQNHILLLVPSEGAPSTYYHLRVWGWFHSELSFSIRFPTGFEFLKALVASSQSVLWADCTWTYGVVKNADSGHEETNGTESWEVKARCLPCCPTPKLTLICAHIWGSPLEGKGLQDRDGKGGVPSLVKLTLLLQN